MKVVLTRPARHEFVEASEFYAQRAGDAVARNFVDDVEHAIASLGEHPRIGSPWLQHYRRLPLARFPYDVVYRVTTESVRILAIGHQRRAPGYWLGRL